MAMFDLSSSWMEGHHCPLAERGYSRAGKKGKAQVEYGLLTDPDGRPVGGRGMVTAARIDALRETTDLGWLSRVGDAAV